MNLKNRTIGLAYGILIFLTLLFIGNIIHHEQQDIDTIKEAHRQDLNRLHELSLERTLLRYTAHLSTLIHSKEFTDLLRTKQKNELYNYLNPLYEGLIKRSGNALRVYHLHLPDGTSFLRMHQPELSGDNTLDHRPLLQKAIETKTVATGFEMGRFGLFYRIEYPLMIDAEFIGVIDLGIDFSEIEMPFGYLHQAFGATIISKENLAVASNADGFSEFDAKHYVKGDAFALALLKELPDIQKRGHTILHLQGKHLFLHTFDITDLGRKSLAQRVYFIDITDEYADMVHTVIFRVLFALAALLLLLYILHTSFDRLITKLMNSEFQFGHLFNNMKNAASIYTPAANGREFIVKDINTSAEKLKQVASHDVIGKNYTDLFTTEEEMRLFDTIKQVNKTGKPQSHVTAHCNGEKLEQWYEHDIYKLPTGEIVVICDDMTEEKKHQEELKLAAKIIENSIEGMLISNAQNEITQINSAFTQVTGYTLQDVQGNKPSILKSGRHDKKYYKAMWSSVVKKGHWQGEIWNRRKNGEVYPQWLSIFVIKNAEGKVANYIGLFSDITHHEVSKERMLKLAHYDVLTGLPNRLLFGDRLKQSIIKAQRVNRKLALMFLDLDRFKNINDTLGHNIGDILLQQVAQRLVSCIRRTDTVARLGGDEFVIILEAIQNNNKITDIAEIILNVFDAPFRIEGYELFVTTSIGISIFPDDGGDAQTVLKHADTAMYQAKEAGRNNYQYFEPDMNLSSIERLSMENDLRKALEKNELVLHYQPQYDIAENRIIGVEALIRWEHPQHGLIAPFKFIPLAEETGLILKIGEWVLHEACRQNMLWMQNGLEPIVMAVNISSKQFNQKEFIDIVKKTLDTTGLPPAFLELEVTESIVMHKTDTMLQKLKEIKEIGINLSIDDFGTGYSSLSYLKLFPIDKLKIDRSFVKDIGSDANDEAIASAIIAMAKKLNLKAIAEGVETVEQLEFLKQAQCDEVQGYYFERPQDAESIASLLKPAKQYKKTESGVLA